MSTASLAPLSHTHGFKNLLRAVDALRLGQAILLVDDPKRENEGDLVIAGEKITENSMNFLIKNGSGIVCLALPTSRTHELNLPLMVPEHTHSSHTAFTVSIEAKVGVTTGVSAADRAHTILVAMADNALSSHLARPGHIFPLAAKEQGVFERMGHTEGSLDLLKIAGLKPGAVLCELMNEDGTVARGAEREKFAARFNLAIISIEEILCYRIKHEPIAHDLRHVSSQFGKLSWQSFTFLGLVVDIFHQKPSFDETVKLQLVESFGLKARFMAQILLKTDDDPLATALLNLKNGHLDLVIMLSEEPTTEPKIASVLAKALICRALFELKVKSFIGHEDPEFTRIAGYFELN